MGRNGAAAPRFGSGRGAIHRSASRLQARQPSFVKLRTMIFTSGGSCKWRNVSDKGRCKHPNSPRPHPPAPSAPPCVETCNFLCTARTFCHEAMLLETGTGPQAEHALQWTPLKASVGLGTFDGAQNDGLARVVGWSLGGIRQRRTDLGADVDIDHQITIRRKNPGTPLRGVDCASVRTSAGSSYAASELPSRVDELTISDRSLSKAFPPAGAEAAPAAWRTAHSPSLRASCRTPLKRRSRFPSPAGRSR